MAKQDQNASVETQTPEVDREVNQRELCEMLARIGIVFNSKKAGRNVEIDIMSLPASSILAVLRYGAQRFINDKLGGSELGQEEAGKKFDEIMKQLEEGWIDRRGTGGGNASLSPLEKKINELAREQIKGALKQKGIPLKQVGKDKMAELTSGLVKKNREQLETQAQRMLDIEKESLNLGDLNLDL